MKFVGIDYGLARTGLAVSDPEGRLAFPVATLRLADYPNRRALLDALAQHVHSVQGQAIVMGLPLLADGTESLTTRQVRHATERLKRRLPMPFYYMNEELSSEEAWEDLRRAGMPSPRRAAVLDQQAAVRILSSFLALDPSQRRQA